MKSFTTLASVEKNSIYYSPYVYNIGYSYMMTLASNSICREVSSIPTYANFIPIMFKINCKCIKIIQLFNIKWGCLFQ